MIATRYYPKLTSVLKLDSLPDKLSFIENGLDNLLDDIFVRDYQIVKSRSGDAVSYRLTLKIYKRLGIEIPGAFTILLNPPQVGDPDPLSTEIPMSVQVQAEILKYVQNFDLLNFSADPQAFFDLFLALLGIDEDELIDDLIAAFTLSNSVNEIVSKINDANGLTGTANAIPYPTSTSRIQQIEDLITSIQTNGSGITVVGAVFALLADAESVDSILENLNQLFRARLGQNPLERLKKLFIPKILASIKLTPAIEFPRNVLLPLKPNGEVETDVNIKSRLDFTVGEFTFSTEGGIGFETDLGVTFPAAYPKAQIGNTGLTIGFTNAKIDLSSETNIPEATADGRPDSFKGVYIEEASIGLPNFIKPPNTANPVGVELVGRNLIIGTGGLSGKIALETTGPGLCKKFGDSLEACFNSFDITFKQNSVISSNINGTLIVPGFKDTLGNPAEININVHFAEDGDFQVTASEAQSITALKLENILSIELKSIFVGRKDGRWFFGLSGAVKFEDLGGAIGQFIPEKIEVKKLIIWEDGKIELEGGKLTLPKAVSLKLGPVKLSVTAIGLGSHEGERVNSNTNQPEIRQYKYFTFDGGISVNPGGVDASGNGITLYWTTDNDTGAGRDPHIYMRIQSIAIDIIIPGDAKPADATLLLSGFLAMKDTASGTEYQGGVSFTLPQLKMGGSASMRLNPKIPAFLIDVGLELSSPIVLGSTGLGIYGFRGLVGQRYVSTKSAAGVDETEPWWKYYKAKVAPDYREGIQTSKFEQKDGFSLGAGVSLATAPDGGKAFSSKVFFLLSLPEVFLIQGQGQILKERIGLDTTTDPPFFAMIAITSTSVETAIGVNYMIPDDGDEPGAIATVNGVLEMGFFWADAFAWYINIGKDQPVERRIQVRLLKLFNAYFYFMLSNNGIRAGAGASFEAKKKFGPLKAELKAYLDVAGQVSFRPKQMGGSIQLGGSVSLKIFRFGFTISASASLAAESPKPFIVSGRVEVCVRVLRKNRCAKFSFTWTFRNQLDTSETPLFKSPLSDSGKALNIHTRETFELWTGTSLPGSPDSQLANNVIPLDSYIDIEFLKGVKPSTTVQTDFGGNTMGSAYVEYVAPQRGKSDRVKHEYTVSEIEILYHNGSSWQPFDLYAANTPMSLASFVTTNLAALKQGYWQYQSPNLHNKLRILAQSPISYVSQGSGGLVLENSGITTQEIFCAPTELEQWCVDFTNLEVAGQTPPSILIPQDQLIWHERFMFRMLNGDGVHFPRVFNQFTKAVHVGQGEQFEIILPEPQVAITIQLEVLTTGATVTAYQRVADTQAAGTLTAPTYSYQQVSSTVVNPGGSMQYTYSDTDQPIDRLIIDPGVCESTGGGEPDPCEPVVTQQGWDLEAFLNGLASNGDLLGRPNLMERPYDTLYMGSSLANSDCKETPSYRVADVNEEMIRIEISDGCGKPCVLELYFVEADGRHSFSSIGGFTNLRPDPERDYTGPDPCFLIDAVIPEQGTVTLRGCGCWDVIDCFTECEPTLTAQAEDLETLLTVMAENRHLTSRISLMEPPYDEVYRSSSLHNPECESESTYDVTDYNETTLTGVFDDGCGIPCPIELSVWNSGKGKAQSIDFNRIIRFTNLRHDPNKLVNGENYCFLIDAMLDSGEVITLEGCACWAVIFCEPVGGSGGSGGSGSSGGSSFICDTDITDEAKQLDDAINSFKDFGLFNTSSAQLYPGGYYNSYRSAFFNSALYGDPRETADLTVTYTRTIQSEEVVAWKICDSEGYCCDFRLELVETGSYSVLELFDWNNLRPDPDYTVAGANYHFLIDAKVPGGGVATVRGWTSCYAITNCVDCGIFVYQVCGQNVIQALFNATIPTQSWVDQEVQTIVNAFNGSIHPIWRPDTNYAIRVVTKDKLNREGGGFLTEYNRTSIFAFRTMGPIGHFHIHKNDGGTLNEVPEYQALLTTNSEDEFKLQSLLHYMDFGKCYPNADGQLINAKPLFYISPTFLLYYTQNYVYQMLNSWSAYGSLNALDVEFVLTVIDPALDESAGGAANQTGTLSWTMSSLPIVSEDITILNNMMTYGTPCQTTTLIEPQNPVSNFLVAQLEPLKLYTASYTLRYKRAGESQYTDREVLRYPFQTSRYSSFTEQVQSWQLSETTVVGTATGEALFKVEKAFDATTNIAVAVSVLDDSMAKDDNLRQEFGDPFNRLLEGALKLEAIDPAQGTEFNLVIDTNTGNVIGVLVKSPEPFNDPKVPFDTLPGAPMIGMTVNGGGTFEDLRSKDNSEVFITTASMNTGIVDGDTLEFNFRYVQYDGVDYVDLATETVSFTVSL